jgi:hypothetical protein
LQLSVEELEVLINLWALAVLTQELGEDRARETLQGELLSAQVTA